ncbi:polysaccharide deacetylase family protein [Salininema proteolyticum]|uniref:Polysaccharide deacetylase family protein n=1 Tax=Salininema proteolyticum TaxID=1607685 RepID=A0ABV8TZJ1_9ACTN
MTKKHLISSIALTAAVGALVGIAVITVSWPGRMADTRPASAGTVYLTFDDGPGEDTGAILDLLAKHYAKATFFMQGVNVGGREETVERILDEGHKVGNHTWSHPDLTGLSDAEKRHEFERTDEALKKAGASPKCSRPPYGATDDDVKDVQEELGLRQTLWSVDTGDALGADEGKIVRLVESAEDRDVVLTHDGGGDRSATLHALERALPKLADKGLRFESLPYC